MIENNLKKYARDISGQFALTFVLVSMVLLMGISVAIDMANATRAKSELQDAADVAALAIAKNQLETGNRHENFEKIARETILEVSGVAREMQDIAISASVVWSPENVATVTVRGSVSSNLLPLPKHNLGVTSVAATAAEHLDVYLMLDKSYSMLIADGPINIARLRAITKDDVLATGRTDAPNGCAFACHQPTNFEPAGKTMFDIARDNGITLRSDVLADAATGAARALITGSKRTRIGAIDFHANANMTQIPTRNLRDIENAINTSSAAYPNSHTNYHFLFELINSTITSSGNGTEQDPRKVMVLVTDGLYNHWGDAHFPVNANYSPIEQSLCDSVKSRNIKLAVIYVEYERLPGDTLYQDEIAPIYGGIKPALESCATEDLFYEARSGASIRNAFNQMARDLKKVYPYVIH